MSREAHTPEGGAAGHPPVLPGRQPPRKQAHIVKERISPQLEPGDDLRVGGDEHTLVIF